MLNETRGNQDYQLIGSFTTFDGELITCDTYIVISLMPS
ncbi:hypothetical protein AAKU52_003346 [Pedobacter sp. CG_S7]